MLPAQSVPNCICSCHFTSFLLCSHKFLLLAFPNSFSTCVSLSFYFIAFYFFLSLFFLLLLPKTSNRLGWEKEGMFRIKKESWPPEHAHWTLGEKKWSALLRAPFFSISLLSIRIKLHLLSFYCELHTRQNCFPQPSSKIQAIMISNCRLQIQALEWLNDLLHVTSS